MCQDEPKMLPKQCPILNTASRVCTFFADSSTPGVVINLVDFTFRLRTSPILLALLSTSPTDFNRGKPKLHNECKYKSRGFFAFTIPHALINV